MMVYAPAGLTTRRDGAVQVVESRRARYEQAQHDYAARLAQVASIGHHAIPVIDDRWLDRGILMGVGTWQSGCSLSTAWDLRRHDRPVECIRQWIRILCDALMSLHDRQLIHGNLHFPMFRVRATNELMLPLVGGELFVSELPPCMAPEQVPHTPMPAPLGPWTDIYQLSAVVYQLLTGTAPPTASERSIGVMLESVADHDLVREWPELIKAMQRGLSMRHQERPASVATWLELAGIPDRRNTRRQPSHDAQALLSWTSSVANGQTETQRRSPNESKATVSKVQGLFAQPRGAAEVLTFDDDLAEQEETPLWVWTCLVIAVAAFLSILARTL
jgi:hypothetical protein